jgi:histidinol-phosphate aminotransferase
MKNIQSLARPGLLTLKPYSSARDEFQGEADIFLDANENPFGFGYKGIPNLNRYPDPLQRELKKALSARTGIPPEAIFTGNGSDEIIDLMIRAFCNPGTDSIIINPPTYGMYEVQARINNVPVLQVPLTADFHPDEAGIARAEAQAAASGNPAKILFLCSPNNPTGNLIPTDIIARITKSFGGIVLVDEAYIDFSGTPGSLRLLNDFNNLMIIRTFSKARGMAAARLGIGYSSEAVISLLNLIKLPYNVNSITIDAGRRSLGAEAVILQQVNLIIEERNSLSKSLSTMKGILKVWPSDANFILVEVEKPKELYRFLLSRGIVVRDRSSIPGCEGCLRITVGSPPQNSAVITSINEFFTGDINSSAQPGTEGFSNRRTNETDIYVKFRPNGRGIADVQTGVGFLDHMLELFTFHSGSDIIIRGNGDLQVDSHHLTEDVAITLGTAVAEALKGRSIERYGFTLPMDESLATVSVDMGGRAVLVWNVDLKENMLGDMPAEMVNHFFQSFATAARCTLHITAEGANEHHIVEAIFKAFGRAMRMALKPSQDGGVPSTKGVI